MAEKAKLKKLKEEFLFLKDKALGVLLYGSNVDRTNTAKSDVDICIVAPKQKPSDILRIVHQKIDVYKKKCDLHFFEELPLYIKAEILKNHAVLVTENLPELYEYSYVYRKLWDEQKHRQ